MRKTQDETRKVYTFLAIFGAVIIGIGLMWIVIYITSYSITTHEKVKCYDRFGNEIIGQTCLEEHKTYEDGLNGFILPIFLIFVGFGWIVISIYTLENEGEKMARKINLNNHKEI